MSEILNNANDISKNVLDTGVKAMENISDTTSGAIQNSLNTITNSTETVKNMATEYLGNSSALFYGLIVLVILSMIIGYGLYIVITDNVIYQQKITVEGTGIPLLCNEMSEHKITQYLSDTNGKRRTFSFWIYINDINKYSGQLYRHIAHIGSSQKDLTTSSPYIFLDNLTNKIHVRFSPDDLNSSLNLVGKMLNDITNINELLIYNSNKSCGFTIDYIPIQRWVHVAFSINDKNGGVIYVYIDGELIKVIDGNNYDANPKINVAELKFSNKGNLYVGGNINDSTNRTIGFSGLLSKFTMYNYDLNQNDIYKEYNNGPFSGVLTKLGLGAYGLRNPIYKLNTGS